MTELEVRGVLKLIAAAYPAQRQRMSNDDVRAMAAVYTAGLIDLDRERVSAAVNRLVKASKWIPTIAEIREAAVDVAHGSRRAGGEAWGEVVYEAQRICALSEHDVIRSPELARPRIADPIAIAAARAIGWTQIRDRRVDDVATRSRFVELYDQLAKDERKEAAIAPNAISTALPKRIGEPREIRELVHGLAPQGGSR